MKITYIPILSILLLTSIGCGEGLTIIPISETLQKISDDKTTTSLTGIATIRDKNNVETMKILSMNAETVFAYLIEDDAYVEFNARTGAISLVNPVYKTIDCTLNLFLNTTIGADFEYSIPVKKLIVRGRIDDEYKTYRVKGLSDPFQRGSILRERDSVTGDCKIVSMSEPTTEQKFAELEEYSVKTDISDLVPIEF